MTTWGEGREADCGQVVVLVDHDRTQPTVVIDQPVGDGRRMEKGKATQSEGQGRPSAYTYNIVNTARSVCMVTGNKDAHVYHPHTILLFHLDLVLP